MLEGLQQRISEIPRLRCPHTHTSKTKSDSRKRREDMMRHIDELMIGGIRDMRYYTTACDLQAANGFYRLSQCSGRSHLGR